MERFVKIKDIAPVDSGSVHVLGLVTQKQGSVRAFTGSRGSNSVFNFTLKDDTASIRVSCWGEAATEFHGSFEIGDVVELTSPTIKSKGVKSYGPETTSDYEMSFDDCVNGILLYTGGLDLSSFKAPLSSPRNPLILTTFDDLEQVVEGGHPHARVNLLGIVHEVIPTKTVPCRTGRKELTKIVLYDRCGKVTLSIWGEGGSALTARIAAKINVKPSKYKSSIQGILMDSEIILSPKCKYAHDLLRWSDGMGGQTAITEFFSAAADSTANVGSNEQGLYVKDLAAVTTRLTIRDALNDSSLRPCFFYACILEIAKVSGITKCCTCRNRLQPQPSQLNMSCMNVECAEYGKEGPLEHSIFIKCSFIDATGTLNGATLFSDVSDKLLGISAEEWNELTSRAQEESVRNMLWQRMKVYLQVKCKDGQSYPNIIGCEHIDFDSYQHLDVKK